jgi:cyclophilin family peptidyl-prolyl cis-trans isomerase
MIRQLILSLACGLCALAAHAGPLVELKTNMGVIVIELDTQAAPRTTSNFLQYVQEKHYDGTIFHRVINGFMIQGGGMDAAFKEKPTRAPIENEAQNGLKNTVGTVAMARTNAPHSASAQFFINLADNAFLDHKSPEPPENWGYAVFGKVVKGMDVVQKIAKLQTGSAQMHQNVPTVTVVIEEARVIESTPDNAQETKAAATSATRAKPRNRKAE